MRLSMAEKHQCASLCTFLEAVTIIGWFSCHHDVWLRNKLTPLESQLAGVSAGQSKQGVQLPKGHRHN
jgi:hypothetical protein